MINRTQSIALLRNTTYVLSLARRAALSSANSTQREQALQLGPVLRELKGLARTVDSLQQPETARVEATRSVRPDSVAADESFQTLLAASARRAESAAQGAPAGSPLERTTVALNMARQGAPELEIARALGLSRGEVDLILSIARQRSSARL